ncbi:hypothetical protein [Blastomonas sp.]|uniref:hypothetical protein n=1 Tax=Blastomonas sp. TaxID=1909299 RepID=UPI0035941EFB
MIYIWLNLTPILAATALGLVIGFVWTKSGKVKISKRVVLAAIPATFWLTAILAGALILAPSEAEPWTMAIGSAFIIWIGFVLPVLVVTLSVRGERISVIASACGYWLITMLAQAALLQAMGLVAPGIE